MVLSRTKSGRTDMITFGIGLVLFFIMFITFTGSYRNSNPLAPTSNKCASINLPARDNTGISSGIGNGISLGFGPKPNTFFTNNEGDTLTNPYAPPLKDVITPSSHASRGVPINMSTNIGAAINTSYQQIGLLTKANASASTSGSGSDPVIMPLMGKPLFTSRDKWLFYTISDKNNAMKLPIIIKGRNALSEIGVDSVYTGDTVYVQGYNDQFKVTLYENSSPQYIPFI
jgi:hypothetical protein